MSFKEEMIKHHSHAEIQNDINPDTIVYTEESVIALMKYARDKALEWTKQYGRIIVSEEVDYNDANKAKNYIDYLEISIPSEKSKVFKKIDF